MRERERERERDKRNKKRKKKKEKKKKKKKKKKEKKKKGERPPHLPPPPPPPGRYNNSVEYRCVLSAELGAIEGFGVRGGSAGSLVIGGDGGGASGEAVGYLSLQRREAQDAEIEEGEGKEGEGKEGEGEGKEGEGEGKEGEGNVDGVGGTAEEKEHRRGQQSALDFIHAETSPPRVNALRERREGFPGSPGNRSPSWRRLSAETSTWSLSLPAAGRSMELALEGMLSGAWSGVSRARPWDGGSDGESEMEATEWVSVFVFVVVVWLCVKLVGFERGWHAGSPHAAQSHPITRGRRTPT